METAELVRELGKRVGVELELDSNGSISFEADGMMLTVNDLPTVGAVAFSGDVGEPPPEKLEGLYRLLLESQHIFRETSGATISLDPETGRFTLNKAIPLSVLDNDTFYTQLDMFVNTLETFTSIVRDYRGAVTNSNQSEADAPGLGDVGQGDFVMV